VPFQYLIATAHWRDLILSVGPGILVPRPETELMIDLAAAALQANPALGQLPWADLGTGSGALAIGAAKLLQQQQQQQQRGPNRVMADGTGCVAVQVYAVDLSASAVAYATANAAACGVQDAVHTVRGSWYEPLLQLKGRLGCVLSNPPYIPCAEIEAGLQAEVGQHEPMSALDGGPGTGMQGCSVRSTWYVVRNT
jgi:release factor glutamine methyltransferase